MEKQIRFMRDKHYTKQEEKEAIDFIAPLFEDDAQKFRDAIMREDIYLDSSRFTYILHKEKGKKYRMMGTCTGPILYLRDILNIDDPDDKDI